MNVRRHPASRVTMRRQTLSGAVSETNLTQGYLRTADAARYLGIGQSTLERKRVDGTGPQFRVLGSKIVVYAVADLDTWASGTVLSSTSERIAA
jgi:predicted DNA-binding transcriptional regulator AlpA